MKKDFPKEYYRINQIFTEWNPIEVEGPALENEYVKIIPLLMKFPDNKQRLIEIIEDYLINDIGINYNRNDKKHKEQVFNVVNKILSR